MFGPFKPYSWEWTSSIIKTTDFERWIGVLNIVILAWTAIEAKRSAVASSKATELKLLPLIVLHYKKGSGSEGESYVIENLGEGVAHNIRIDPPTLIFTDTQEIWEFRMKIPGTNILSKGENKIIDMKTIINTREKYFDVFARYALHAFKFSPIIKFSNVFGEKYYVKVKIKSDFIEILIPTHKIGIADNISFIFDRAYTTVQKLWYIKVIWPFKKSHIKFNNKEIPF